MGKIGLIIVSVALAAGALIVTVVDVQAGRRWRPPPVPFGSFSLQQPPTSQDLLKDFKPSLRSTLPRFETPQIRRGDSPSGPSSEERIRQGYKLIDQKRYAEAIDLLYPLRNSYPAARQGIIFAMLQLGNYFGAIRELNQAHDYPGKTQNLIFAYQNHAIIAFEKGFIEMAVEALQGLKKHRPNDAVRMLFQIGDTQFAKQRYEEAILAYQGIGADAKAYAGKARAEFALNRIDDAFATLGALSRQDRRKATLLKGDLLVSIGAYPLAIEQYTAYPNNPNVARIMDDLEKAGLARFHVMETFNPEWRAYETVKRFPAGDPLTFLFQVKDGVVQPSPVFKLSWRSAPRGWSVGLAWKALKHMQLPETKQAKELRLTVNIPGSSQIAAIWGAFPPFPPSREDILKALDWANKAAGDFRKGETALHDGDTRQALEYFTQAASMPYVWADRIDEWPHYAALTYALKTLLAFSVQGSQIKISIASIRGLLFDRYPFWGRLSWAQTLAENKEIDAARSLFEDITDDWPGRYEAAEQRAETEWYIAGDARGPERGLAFYNMQRALEQVLELKPGYAPAVVSQAQLYLVFGSYALASQVIVKADTHLRDSEASGLYNYLTALRQREFDKLGSLKSRTSGLTFEIYQNREGPPEDDTLIHHSAEIAVRDERGMLIENFVISSQAFEEGSPRNYFLDRISSSGRDTLASYGRSRPDPRALAKELVNL